MIATINGIRIEGTPEEIKALLDMMQNKIERQPVQYVPYPVPVNPSPTAVPSGPWWDRLIWVSTSVS